MNSFIQLEHVQHRYGNEFVLKEVNLQIRSGKLFGLLGPSGSGKTTLVKIMLGLLQPTNGSIFINNTRMPSLTQMKQIGYMAQSDALYNDLTAKENLEFFAEIYGIQKQERKIRIAEVARIVNLTDHLNKPLEKFSGGMRRRMSLAVSLLHRPELLILDEPTVGIDPVLRASIWKDLKKLQELGTTIVITTHVMDEAAKCDQLAMLRQGRIIADGSPDDLRRESGAQTLEDAFLFYGKERREM